MRCIEMAQDNILNPAHILININMRCIEINLNKAEEAELYLD